MVDSKRAEAADTAAGAEAALPGRRGSQEPGAPGSPSPAAIAEPLKPGSIAFDLARNMRYHAAREAWLSFCSRATKAASLIVGAGAVAALLGRADQSVLAAGLAATVVVLQMIDLVFDLPARARQHATLRQRFAALNASLVACRGDEDRLRSIEQDLASIYGEEPPTFSVVDAMAWNGTYRSTRHDVSADDLIPITGWQRLTAHLVRRDDFDSRSTRERNKAPKQAV